MAEFDPDLALGQMLEFLTGHRTEQGYARLADTVRGLHVHLAAGGRLPRDWRPADRERELVRTWRARAADYRAEAAGATREARVRARSAAALEACANELAFALDGAGGR